MLATIYLYFIPMLKMKRNQSVLVALLVLTMVAMYGFVPVAGNLNAASLTDASDTISDSDRSVSATHDIFFNVDTELDADDIVRIIFETGFTDVATLNDGGLICPVGIGFQNAASSSGNIIECTVDALQTITSAEVVNIVTQTITNPGSAGDYDVTIQTYHDTDMNTILDESTLKVYIIDDVSVTATVDSTLTFGIAAVDAEQTVNGVDTTATSTATTIPFGTLTSAASSSVAQELTVSTNADDGYSVTVQQDGPLTSAAGATIDSFIDATAPGAPDFWQGPGGTLDQTDEYGHMGVTTNDSDLTANFTSSRYDGLDGTTALEVMSHDGPADGTTQDSGLARVLYTVEITDLQEAGDYSSTLTYICTPTY